MLLPDAETNVLQGIVRLPVIPFGIEIVDGDAVIGSASLRQLRHVVQVAKANVTNLFLEEERLKKIITQNNKAVDDFSIHWASSPQSS